jgi:hypothetical protein
VSRGLGVLVMLLAAKIVRAEGTPERDPDVREVDRAVCGDEKRAATWNTAWTTTFAVAAMGSAGVAALASGAWLDDDRRAGLYVTAAKASIAVVDKIVDPLDVSGLCGDAGPRSREIRRGPVDEAARRERRVLLENVVGGLALNTAGLLYLGYGRDAWATAWTSFAVGTAVSVASTLTAPIQSWLLARRLDRGRDIAMLPWLDRDRTGVAFVASW